MTWEVPAYVAEELLGFGGSGEVWRARAAMTGEVVALKRLRAGRDPAERDRLRWEAALLAAFEHPHVVRLHGVLSTAGGPVLVLDYAEGGSLAALVSQRGPCSAAELSGLLAPIAGALAAAHDVGLVHGDLSAGNILLGAGGQALLADLGTARLVGECGGVVRGTAGFIDPAVRAGAPPGPASDVYGLAAVAVFALTGDSGLVDPAAALSGLALPEPMARVLRAALQADPAARPCAAGLADGLSFGQAEPVQGVGAMAIGEAATALTHAVEGGRRPPVPSPAAGRHRSTALRGRLGATGRRVVTRTVAAVILVVAAAGAGLVWGGAAPGQQPAGAAATRKPTATPSSWARVWADLDAHRARAFATADAMLLDDVYLPGCPALPVDLTAVRSLAARQAHATGVEHQVISVRAESVTAGSVTLLVVDRLRGYDIRDAAGRVLASSPPRSERTLRAGLVHTARGWRIAQLTS
ncbi:MAG: serine/threonine protein kinase [Actinomycetota bacterium]|nr:serine/threonine protein kinase [Actinomycetota bacterium]